MVSKKGLLDRKEKYLDFRSNRHSGDHNLGKYSSKLILMNAMYLSRWTASFCPASYHIYSTVKTCAFSSSPRCCEFLVSEFDIEWKGRSCNGHKEDLHECVQTPLHHFTNWNCRAVVLAPSVCYVLPCCIAVALRFYDSIILFLQKDLL
jgi:hypothetical protein